MADGFETYHVPQQSRRDKLRVGACFPDSSPTVDHNNHNLHHQGFFYDPCPVKDETVNSMGFASSAAAGGGGNHHHYLDPHQFTSPSSVQDNPYPFLCNFDGSSSSYGSHEVFVFKPEPLSLSLSSHGAGVPLLELNLQRYGGGGGGYVVPGVVGGGGGGGGSGSTSNEVSRSSVPLGPFTGYASVLKGSRFLRPAQQLLEEFCDAGRGICAGEFAADPSLMEENPALESFRGGGGGGDDPGSEDRRKKSKLISMLDEVYRRYKQYYQQMQTVVASFECVAGLGNAAPYANLALKTMSKHFKYLKDAIADQLQFTNKGPVSHGKEEAARFVNADRGFYSQRSVNNNSGYLENQPVWRPQRGLPERAVTVLRAWLFEHFLHPYPTDTDKLMLAKQTGLSRSQVSNWFINARVRLWKPMVEEIHMLETRQAHKGMQRDGGGGGNDNRPTVTQESPSSSQRIQDAPSNVTVRNQEQVNLSYNDLSGHHQHQVSGNVSLTLGLHQNNCIGLSEPFPISAAQRFGMSLEGSSEGYVMGGFEAQHGHFGREGVGGQLLHDFVG